MSERIENGSGNLEIDLDGVDLDINPEPRLPCVLAIDNSGSMDGDGIAQVNEGRRRFAEALRSHPLASKRVEVATVSYGKNGVELVHDFVTAMDFHPANLEAGSLTPMGQALCLGLDLIERREAEIDAEKLRRYQPWMFNLTDGKPTDLPAFEEAAVRIKEREARGRLSFLSFGVAEANEETLARLSNRPPFMLKGFPWVEVFDFVTVILTTLSQSKPGEQVALPAPTWMVQS